MANVTMKYITDLASEQLQDPSFDDLSESQLVAWGNMGSAQIAAFVPSACTVIESVKLAAGPRQTIAASGMVFIRAIRNMGTDGNTPGQAIIMVDNIEILNAFNMSWPTETQVAVIKEVVKDPVVEGVFWTFPPADGSSYIEIERSDKPAPVIWDSAHAWETVKIGITNEYIGALLDYILYRAYSRDADYPGNIEKATLHKQAFDQALGLTVNTEGGK